MDASKKQRELVAFKSLAKLPRYRPNGSNTSNLYTLK